MTDAFLYVIDGTSDESVYGSVAPKAEGMCDLMNRLNHRAKGPFGIGRYYTTPEPDEQVQGGRT